MLLKMWWVLWHILGKLLDSKQYGDSQILCRNVPLRFQTHIPGRGQVLLPCLLVWLVSKCLLSETTRHRSAETWSSPVRSVLPFQLMNEPIKATSDQFYGSVYQADRKLLCSLPDPKRRPLVLSLWRSRPRPGQARPAAAGFYLSWLPAEQPVCSHWLYSDERAK